MMSGIFTSASNSMRTIWFASEYIGPLENSLKELYQSMKDGKYEFATGDLPFMAIVEKYHDAELPFKYLLKRINETHMKGLQV
jgi:hypothetical protein